MPKNRRCAPEDKNKKFSQSKGYEEWENSIEGIIYNLSVFGNETVAANEDAYLIAQTLLKLPKEVRKKVLDEVCFIIADDLAGTVFKMNITTEVIGKLISTGEIDLDEKDPSIRLSTIKKADMGIPFILLNFAVMRKESEDAKMSTIAHEIAHFILGHDGYDPRKRNAEKEADDLIEKWGFKRAYKSYKLFKKRHLKAFSINPLETLDG